MLDYSEMHYQDRKGACSTRYLSNRELIRSLTTGVSVGGSWPANMTMAMRDDRPKNVKLIDLVANLEGLLVASPRVVAFFRQQELPDVELLPISILDHAGAVASSEYAIIHCCHVVDCIDQERSKFEWDHGPNGDDPTMLVEHVVLKADALQGDARMIRPKFVPGKVFYRADLVEAIEAEDFAGVTFLTDLFD